MTKCLFCGQEYGGLLCRCTQGPSTYPSIGNEFVKYCACGNAIRSGIGARLLCDDCIAASAKALNLLQQIPLPVEHKHWTCSYCGKTFSEYELCSCERAKQDPFTNGTVEVKKDANTAADVPHAGVKFDAGKPQWSLLPMDAVEEIVKVLDYGANKYAAHNWAKGMRWTRCIDAAFRHLSVWADSKRGESNSIDHDTGLSHLAHAACNLLFLIAYEKRKMIEFDDRYEGEPKDAAKP